MDTFTKRYIAGIHSSENDGDLAVIIDKIYSAGFADGIQNVQKITIGVHGGVAEVTNNPDNIEVEIIDHDKKGEQ